ncbi:MAG: DUF1330 domain-containing protein [Microthrixaceae bacterium]|nr:DUF1330 domain-containing protein [Microthrixaceae bacterium]MCO5321062.1 DUF1330 domain-containing protein [Microthrixaceae bacterium]
MTNSNGSGPDLHVEPTRAQIERLLGAGTEGPVTMLNLLRYKDLADYSKCPELAPEATISGREAYESYSLGVLPILAELGAEVLLFGPCHPTLIGPETEAWDDIALIRYPGVDSFISMTTSEDYLAIGGHRNAALADSRLVPTGAVAP